MATECPFEIGRATRVLARRIAGPVVVASGLAVPSAHGQDASLLQVPVLAQRAPLNLDNSSFIYRKLPPEAEQRELQINDIVTVLVDYRSQVASTGDAKAKRTASLNAVLSDWLKFDGKDLYPDPQSKGDPRVKGQLDSKFEGSGDLKTNDTLTFRIAAEVVDIRPNGTLVIEARREIQINDEMWIQSLTGVVRRQSIGPDRTVKSDEVAELRISKREKGFVKDSYERGWFTKWYDHWKPF